MHKKSWRHISRRTQCSRHFCPGLVRQVDKLPSLLEICLFSYHYSSLCRPDLSWRDIQHLCIETAQIISPGDESWELTSTGQPYSYKFGFGKLDAFDFVRAAQNWKLVKPQAWFESPPIQLENGLFEVENKFSGGSVIGEDGVESSFEVTSDMLSENNFEVLEHVTVRVWVQHTRRGHVDVSLTSPNGIRSMLAEKRPADLADDGFPGWRFMTVKHWYDAAPSSLRFRADKILGGNTRLENGL